MKNSGINQSQERSPPTKQEEEPEEENSVQTKKQNIPNSVHDQQ